MTSASGNQHESLKRDLLGLLDWAREYLRMGYTADARAFLSRYRERYAEDPASTRRRWACGR